MISNQTESTIDIYDIKIQDLWVPGDLPFGNTFAIPLSDAQKIARFPVSKLISLNQSLSRKELASQQEVEFSFPINPDISYFRYEHGDDSRLRLGWFAAEICFYKFEKDAEPIKAIVAGLIGHAPQLNVVCTSNNRGKDGMVFEHVQAAQRS